MSRDYELGFSAEDGGVKLTLVVADDVAELTGTPQGLRLELLMRAADAKRACELLLYAYGTAFDRRPNGVPITRKTSKE